MANGENKPQPVASGETGLLDSISISIDVGVISLDSFVKGLTRELQKHRHHLISLNEEAIKRGMEFVQQSMKGAHHG